MRRMSTDNAADEPTEPLFHYTGEAALYSIIESEALWFTSIICLDCKKESRAENVQGRCAACYARYRRSTKRMKSLTCEVCTVEFQRARHDARFCSNACRQWSYRKRFLSPGDNQHS
jgi:hypothetical protein